MGIWNWLTTKEEEEDDGLRTAIAENKAASLSTIKEQRKTRTASYNATKLAEDALASLSQLEKRNHD